MTTVKFRSSDCIILIISPSYNFSHVRVYNSRLCRTGDFPVLTHNELDTFKSSHHFPPGHVTFYTTRLMAKWKGVCAEETISPIGKPQHSLPCMLRESVYLCYLRFIWQHHTQHFRVDRIKVYMSAFLRGGK